MKRNVLHREWRTNGWTIRRTDQPTIWLRDRSACKNARTHVMISWSSLIVTGEHIYIYDVYSFTKEICNRSYQIHSIQKESKVNKKNQNTLRLNREQMPQYQVIRITQGIVKWDLALGKNFSYGVVPKWPTQKSSALPTIKCEYFSNTVV